MIEHYKWFLILILIIYRCGGTLLSAIHNCTRMFTVPYHMLYDVWVPFILILYIQHILRLGKVSWIILTYYPTWDALLPNFLYWPNIIVLIYLVQHISLLLPYNNMCLSVTCHEIPKLQYVPFKMLPSTVPNNTFYSMYHI